MGERSMTLELDDEDYDLLGFGAERLYEAGREASAIYAKVRNAEWLLRMRGTPELNRAEYERLKKWRKQAPEKYRAIEKRYRQSAKGKATKSAKNRRYYLRKKAEREARDEK